MDKTPPQPAKKSAFLDVDGVLLDFTELMAEVLRDMGYSLPRSAVIELKSDPHRFGEVYFIPERDVAISVQTVFERRMILRQRIFEDLPFNEISELLSDSRVKILTKIPKPYREDRTRRLLELFPALSQDRIFFSDESLSKGAVIENVAKLLAMEVEHCVLFDDLEENLWSAEIVGASGVVVVPTPRLIAARASGLFEAVDRAGLASYVRKLLAGA